MTAITGHILNEKATRRAAKARSGDGPPAGDVVRSPRSFGELDAALAEMRDAGVTRLIINGGDGTVREVLSRTPEIWGGTTLPDYAIVASGNTNLIARKVGGVPTRDLRRLARASDAELRRYPLRPLTVSRIGERTLRGAILGIGAYEMVTRVAHHDITARHGAQVALAVGKLLTSEEMRDGLMCRVDHDDMPGAMRQRMLFAMTTLPGRLIFGFEPFWGDQTQPIRWLDIDARPRRLLRAAPFIAFGAPRPWMAESYRSGSSRAVTLEITAPFVMDGEPFAAGTDGLVRISAAETATFLTLR